MNSSEIWAGVLRIDTEMMSQISAAQWNAAEDAKVAGPVALSLFQMMPQIRKTIKLRREGYENIEPIEPLLGSDVRHCAAALLIASEATGQESTAIFIGTLVTIKPEDTPQQVMTDWQATRSEQVNG